MRRLLIPTAGVVMLVALGAGGYYLYTQSGVSVSTATQDLLPAPGFATATDTVAGNTAAAEPLKAPRTPPPGYAEYRSEQYRFAFFYPNGLSVSAYDEGQGASTITFQNPDPAQGFQIFIVPYGAQQVSTERFKKDEPSGVMQDPRDVTIDGAIATSFYSTDAALGDTAEVWFIHGGYLFEVTTPKSLAGWLSQIMVTWQFL